MTEKMTVAQALNELKLLDKRIADSKLTPMAIVKNNEVVQGYATNDSFTAKQVSNYQALMDLIKRRVNIKTAIMSSNALTKVTVLDKEITVAEAIESKNKNEMFKKVLAVLLLSQKEAAKQETKIKAEIEASFNKTVESVFGKDASTTKAKDYCEFKEMYFKSNGYKILDPLGISKEIEEISKKTEEFDKNIDFILNKSNIQTEIEV